MRKDREMGMFSLEEGRLIGRISVHINNHKEVVRRMEQTLLSSVLWQDQRQWSQEAHSEHQETLFLSEADDFRHIMPGKVAESPTLVIFQNHMNLVLVHCLSRSVALDDLQRSLPISTTLWAHEWIFWNFPWMDVLYHVVFHCSWSSVCFFLYTLLNISWKYHKYYITISERFLMSVSGNILWALLWHFMNTLMLEEKIYHQKFIESFQNTIKVSY